MSKAVHDTRLASMSLTLLPVSSESSTWNHLPQRQASPVVGQIPSRGHVSAIRKVANVIHVPLQRRRQGRAWSVRIGLRHLRVVVHVAGLVQSSTVWKIANIV